MPGPWARRSTGGGNFEGVSQVNVSNEIQSYTIHSDRFPLLVEYPSWARSAVLWSAVRCPLERPCGMDRIELLDQLDKVARVLRGLGLGRVTRLGRNVLERALTGGLEVNVDGFCLAGSVLHRGHLYAFREGGTEPIMTRLFQGVVEPGMQVIDVGAYLGWYALLAAKKLGSSGRVYAFEADPRTALFLQRNIEVNHFSERVLLFRKAVTSKTGRMKLFLDSSDSSNTSLFHETARSMSTYVDTMALDQYFDGASTVDVIKMDIEGGEIQALEGMERLVRRSKSLTMFVECNPQALRAAGGSSEALIQKLRSLDFEIQVIDEEGQCLRRVTATVHRVKYVNLFCRK